MVVCVIESAKSTTEVDFMRNGNFVACLEISYNENIEHRYAGERFNGGYQRE